MSRLIRILGVRGIPATHGGFETFAERLALHLRDRGWKVVVYCQEDGNAGPWEDDWNGIRRIHISTNAKGALGTVFFDLKTTLHARANKGLCLNLGYNTAVFFLLLRLAGVRNVVNMDGIEWRRSKWGRIAKFWFWCNERIASMFADHLVADHPEILRHLARHTRTSRITMIPYGADALDTKHEDRLKALGLSSRGYSLVVARPEPENSILEIVRSFSACARSHRLVVLGSFNPESNPYHREVMSSASEEVMFPGAIYDKQVLGDLRTHAMYYVHGHRVGGTNPSLVEALGAGSAVIAQDNAFNRWVSDAGALYFVDEAALAVLWPDALRNEEQAARLRIGSRQRFEQGLTWPDVLSQYEALLEHWADVGAD